MKQPAREMSDRRATLDEMRAAGANPYANDFRPTTTIAVLVALYEPRTDLPPLHPWPTPNPGTIGPRGVPRIWWPT